MGTSVVVQPHCSDYHGCTFSGLVVFFLYFGSKIRSPGAISTSRMSVSTCCQRLRPLSSLTKPYRTPGKPQLILLPVHASLAGARVPGSRVPAFKDLEPSGNRLTCCRYRTYDTDTQPGSLLDALPAEDVAVFRRADAAWRRVCTSEPAEPAHVATRHQGRAPEVPLSSQYDVVVLGGTLGIIFATALLFRSQQQQQQPSSGLRVAVVERGILQGRQQEWNISYSDLQTLVDCGVLSSQSDIDAVVATRFPGGVHVGVAGVCDLMISDVMDCGVAPDRIIDLIKRRFISLGGIIMEHTSFNKLDVYDDTAVLTMAQQQQQLPTEPAAGGAGGRAAAFEAVALSTAAAASSMTLSCSVVVDALGGLSPLSAQSRGAVKPESAMLLVGSCMDANQQQQQSAGGSSSSSTADVLWGMTPIDKSSCQQYWFERFPAAGGAAVTTYMFAFTDPSPHNQSVLTDMLDRYHELLPEYLGRSTADSSSSSGGVRFCRGMFGVVPCYPDRTAAVVDRLLPVGDAAANRSAVSLAGFCDAVRNLPRLADGLLEALRAGAVDKQDLAMLQPWCPGVTASTAMQRTMAVYSNQHDKIRSISNSSSADVLRPGYQVLDMLGASLAALHSAAGDEGVRSFLADRLQWRVMSAGVMHQIKTGGAAKLLAYSQFQDDPRGGLRLLLGLAGLGVYSLMNTASSITGPLHEVLLSHSPRLLYRWHRWRDAWKYGSGSDWNDRNIAAAAAAAAGSSAASTDASTSSVAPRHSVDTYEDSLCEGEGSSTADSTASFDDVIAPGTTAVHHSEDECDIIDWSDTPGDGWGSKHGSITAAAAGSWHIGGTSRTSSSSLQGIGWGFSSSRSKRLCARAARGNALGRSCVAAAAGRRNGSSSSCSSNAGDDRRRLELLLLSLVDPIMLNRRKPKPDLLDRVVSIDGPPSSSSSVSSYDDLDEIIQAGSPEAIRLLYPQLDSTRSWDEYEVIDWSDVPNNGWGSSSSSSRGGGGGKAHCLLSSRGCGGGSSSSSGVGAKRGVLQWGSSKYQTVWVASSSSSSSSSRGRMRCVAAAAAAGGGDGSVYEGADAADEGLCSTDQPLCDDPAHLSGDDHDGDQIKIKNQEDDQQQQQQPGKHQPHQSESKKQSGQQKQPRPYMNIVNGRWVPPSKSEAEQMMQGYHTMGPDEGV